MPDPLLLAVIAVFGTVAILVGAFGTWFLVETSPERRRLRDTRQAGASGVLLETPSLTPTESAIVKRTTTLIPRSPKEVTRLRRRFMRAGYETLTPLAVYTVAQLVLVIVLVALPLLLMAPPMAWVVAGFGGLVGWQGPSFALDYLIAKRQKVIRNGLPDALDLMIVCLEAGSAIDQSILKVSDELGLAYPALADEFRMIITETRAGKPRLEAFRNFAARTGVEDVRALVAMLVQTDRFGTSVSQALRTHAETSRTKRRQRAEERAAKIGVKLVFPLVFCLFPAFFVVTLGPAVIKFMQVMYGQILAN
jgi:tight adherence protein C